MEIFFWDLLDFILTAYKSRIILQIEIKKMEDCANKRVSIQNKLKIVQGELHHHSSMQYGAAFFSKNPIARRGSNSEIIQWEKIKKQEIFDLVYRFLVRLISKQSELEDTLNQMKYENEDKTISVSQINICNSEENGDSKNSIGSNEALGSQGKQKNYTSVQKNLTKAQIQKKKETRQPKVSIMVQCLSDFSFNSGSKISCSSLVNISSIKFSLRTISIEMIREIFQQPEAFLINLALCLMMKFLCYSKIRLDSLNAGWILSIATVVAYKIYYDDPVGGLIESFAEILQIKCSQIKDLERYFLDQINFQAVITSEQFHIMLSRIVKS